MSLQTKHVHLTLITGRVSWYQDEHYHITATAELVSRGQRERVGGETDGDEDEDEDNDYHITPTRILHRTFIYSPYTYIS